MLGDIGGLNTCYKGVLEWYFEPSEITDDDFEFKSRREQPKSQRPINIGVLDVSV